MSRHDTVVHAKEVSKKFSRSLRRSIYYGVADIARNVVGLPADSHRLRPQEFWAVDDVSFEVQPGEVLGVIGSNGSGKSTMLKMLNGIFAPDRGEIEIRGRVGALIELGAGFHPMLSGRENVYINATILGMSRREIDGCLDEIIAFADIPNMVLDAPVKTYSSGMQARLGFAVAAHMQAEILLVDEVLSVGDIVFQNRCFQKIMEMRERATVILVSHNLPTVAMICDRALWLDRGKMRMLDTPARVIEEYSRQSMLELLHVDAKVRENEQQTLSGDLLVHRVEFMDGAGRARESFRYGEDMLMRCYYRATRDLGRPYFQLDVRSPRGGVIFAASMVTDGGERPIVRHGEGILTCRFAQLPLQQGVYAVDVNVRPENGLGKLFRQLFAATFHVTACEANEPVGAALGANRGLSVGAVRVPYRWEFDEDL